MTRRALMLAAMAAPALEARKPAIYVDSESAVEAALGRAGGGCEIVLRPGIYRGIHIAREFAGTAAAPTVIRAETKWKATVLGSAGLGISIEAAFAVVDGLEVAGSRIDGIKASADDVTVRNCWVHNNSAQGIGIHGRKRWTIERNLIEFNGQHPQLQHGIYADGEDGVVRGNIIRHNSGYGVQLYPAMRSVTVENNLIHGHSTKGGIVLAAAGGRSAIVNNTIADNAYGIRLMGGSGQVIANNIITGRGDSVSRDADAGDPVLACNLTADAGFVDRTREVYFLAPSSPAIGKASREHAPASDFWGHERSADIGAFPFVAALVPATARAGWHNGWPYRFSSSDPTMDMPDFWSK